LPLRTVVCVKQVIDPEMPPSAFKVDPETNRATDAPGIPPVINGFDENAVEAALRIKDAVGGTVTVLSVGDNFETDVMKKPLSMGADELVLVQDDVVAHLDSYATAFVLSRAISRLEGADLVLCGRQASDWDNSQVPLGLAEILELPCITIGQRVAVIDGGLVVHRALPDGYEVVEAGLPALVTVTNELGEPRYPTLRGIMAAGRKTPTVWTAADLGFGPDDLAPRVLVTGLDVPIVDRECEFIEGESDAESGRMLAMKLHEEGLI
jgi:electron transfer flavoprotein beta subunit